MTKTISIAALFTTAMCLVGCNNDQKQQAWTAEDKPQQCPTPTEQVATESKRLLSNMLSGSTLELLDQSDEKLARAAAFKALESSPDGSSQYWRNPNTDKYGESKVIKTTEGGRCRELYSNVYDQIDTLMSEEKVTYCKAKDQPWTSPVKKGKK